MNADLFGHIDPPLPMDMPSGPGYAAESDEALSGYRIRVPGGELLFAQHFFDRKTSDRALEYFQENNAMDWRDADWADMDGTAIAALDFHNINWKQDDIEMFGKRMPLPRLTAWYGDGAYTYSGIRSQPNPWNRGLLFMKQQIEAATGAHFNSVLLNWYRDGEDYLNWHADDEPELGSEPVIASANFGETRDFLLRRHDDKQRKLKIPLGHGSLLVMRGALQRHWQHAVPKRKRVAGSRFNLTFRHIRTD